MITQAVLIYEKSSHVRISFMIEILKSHFAGL